MGTSAFERLWSEQTEPKPVAPLHAARRSAVDDLWGDDEPAKPLTLEEKVRGALASGYQGLTLGMGNKLTAATRAVLPQALGGTKGFDYDGALKDERARLTRFRRAHPYAAAAAEGVGGVIPALATAGGSTPATIGSSARVGAAYGGAFSVGERDNPTAGEAATAGAVGAVVGAGAGAGLHGATKVPGAAMDYLGIRPSKDSKGFLSRLMRGAGTETVEDRAPQMVLERLRRGDLTLEDVLVQHADASRLGRPATLIDIGGHQMARMARGTQGVPGRGAEQIRSMLQRRREGAPVRVAQDAEGGLGQQRADAFRLRQEISGRQVGKSKPLYDAALDAPDVQLDTPVQSEDGAAITLGDLLQRPSAQKAIGYGKQLAAETGEQFPDLAVPTVMEDVMGNLPPEALAKFHAAAQAQGVQIAPAISMTHLHNLKLRLDEMIGYAKANGSLPDGTPATSKMLRAIESTKNQIRGIMDTHTKGKYAEARKVWAGEAELDDALALGEGFLNAKRPLGELQHELSQLSEAGQEYARIGAANALRDAIDRAPDGADVVRRIFGNEAMRQRVRTVFPDDASFQRFREQMEMESQLARNETMVLGNSQTAEKAADAADIMGQMPPATMSTRGVMDAVMRSKIAERLRGMAEQRVDALAPYLTAGGPTADGVSGSVAAREEMLRKIQAAATRRQRTAPRSHVTRALAGQLTSGVTRP